MPLALTFLVLTQSLLDSSPRLTVQYTGNVDTLLREISRRAKVTLKAADGKGKEILIVSLAGATLSDAMERIGWATYGRWERDGETYRLVRDAKSERAAEREFTARGVSDVSSAFEAYRAKILKEELTTASVRKAAEAMSKIEPLERLKMPRPTSPAERALARALAAVKPESVVLTSPDSWCAYSDAPTPCQTPLGDVGREVLSTYASDSLTWTEADTHHMMMIDPSPAVRVVVSAEYTLGGMASIGLYGQDGRRVGRAYMNIQTKDTSWAKPPKEVLDAIPALAAVPLSQASKFFAARPVRENANPTPEELAQIPEVLERLRNPERYDPLGTFVTDVWTAIGARTGRSIVANVRDSILVPSWSGGPPLLKDAIRQLWEPGARVEPGWIVARPALPNPPWTHRIDRSALGRYARTGPLKGLPLLEAAAAFAAGSGSSEYPRAVDSYLNWARLGEVTIPLDWNMLRLFGSLPLDLRRAWIAGDSIPIAGLLDAQRRALRAWAAGEVYAFEDIFHEPTVRFPRGLPDQGWLKSTTEMKAGFYVRIPGGDGKFGERWESLQSLALSLNVRESGAGDWLGDFQIQEAPQPNLRFFAVFSPQDQLGGVFLRGLPPDPRNYVPWAQAPAEMRARVKAAQANLRLGKPAGG